MNKDLFNGVLVEATAPWILKLIEKYLEYFACFDPNAILGIVEALEEFDVGVSNIIITELILYILKDVPHEHSRCISQIICPVVIEAVFQIAHHLLVAVVQLVWINQLLLDHFNLADDCGLSDADIWFAGSPHCGRDEDHLHNDV